MMTLVELLQQAASESDTPNTSIEGKAANLIERQAAQIDHLQMALADTEALERGTGERLAKVEQQLAEAQAALVMKNSCIEDCHAAMLMHDIQLGGDLFGDECRECETALDIQPGTEALEKWLGDPVAYCDLPGRLKYTRNGVTRYTNAPDWVVIGDSLYAKPKGIY